MATTYLQGRAGALYYITEAVPGTYLAPTQASNKALRVISCDITLAGDGGVVQIEEDETPYGGGSLPILDGIAATAELVLRVPQWPGTQPHAETDLPAMYALLASMPLSVTTTNAIVWSPTSSFVAGTSPLPASFTYLENNGNVVALRGCVAIISEIRTAEVGIEMVVTVHGLMQSTLASTIQALSGASLTIGAVAYTTSDNAWILSRGATITLTGATGSGVFALRDGSVVPGMDIQRQVDRRFPHGYGFSYVANPKNSSMVLMMTALDAAALAIEDDMLAQTAITAASITWGSAAAAFSLSLGANNRILSATRSVDAGVRMFEVTLVGAPSASGNDQFKIQWGTP